RTSVARKTHMPSRATSCCWRKSTNWNAGAASGILRPCLAFDGEVVGLALHHGRRLEIMRRRRRWCLPFQARGLPWIGRRTLPEEQRPAEIEQRQRICDRESRSAHRGHHVPDLKFRRVDVITPRHAKHAENELRKERHVKAEEYQDRGGACPVFG